VIRRWKRNAIKAKNKNSILNLALNCLVRLICIIITFEGCCLTFHPPHVLLEVGASNFFSLVSWKINFAKKQTSLASMTPHYFVHAILVWFFFFKFLFFFAFSKTMTLKNSVGWSIIIDLVTSYLQDVTIIPIFLI